jgi:predicted regulator of Ras-like GTPase activity (Roadblock/LC7/MglB family)
VSFFRNLFGRRTAAGKTNGTTTLEAPRPSLPMPEQRSAPPEQRPTPAPAEPASPEECIPLPLRAITDLFSPEMKSTVLRKHPSEHVQVEIPRSLILPQLSSGAVRITFAQLRARTPEVFFHPNGAPADATIPLPLDAILRQMMPSRREDQRQPSVPSNIPAIFAKAGTPAHAAAGGGAEPWYSHRRPTYDGPGTEIPPEPEMDDVVVVDEAPEPEAEPAPAPARAAAPSILPAPPSLLPTPQPMVPVPPEPFDEKPAPAAPKPEPAPAAEAAPAAPGEPKPEFKLEPKTEYKLESRPDPVPIAETPVAQAAAPIPADVAAPVAPEDAAVQAAVDASDCVSVSLAMVGAGLPSEISKSLDSANADAVSFHIPFDEFEKQMRTGKLRFKWSQLHAWCRPAPSAPVTDDPDIDLPLAELIPIFLSRRKSQENRKKFEIDSRIPDVFGKTAGIAPAAKPKDAPAPEPVAAAAPKPAPAPAPVMAVAPKPATAPEPVMAAAPKPAPAPAPVVAIAPAPSPEPVDAPAPSDPIPFVTAAATPAPVPAAEAGSVPVPFPIAAASAAPSGSIRPLRVEPPPATAQQQASHAPSDKILHRIRALDGVIGAFLATSDGLLIAADLPEANEKILAAFAPAAFSQLAKYSEMAELGLPEAVDLHLNAGTIHVRKAGKIFVGVLSPKGHPLPLPELNLISAALQPYAS